MADPKRSRTAVRRLPERGQYDRAALDAVLDEGWVCHVGLHSEQGTFVIPTSYWRDGDWIYFHGSTGSRLLRHLGSGAQVCVCVTLLDGLVLARSAFHHSMNYRSAVIFGVPERVDGAAKLEALHAFTERVASGRWQEIRQPSDAELKGTTVVRLRLEEFSVKQRSGPPGDEPEDYALPVWAGVIPMQLTFGAPVPDPRLANVPAPPYLKRFSRTRSS